jgi:predicted glycosyltransferase
VSTIFYLIGIILYCIKESIKEKPNIYLGFGSSPCAITAYIFKKPSILIDDTEHNKINHLLYKPFCSVVLTPFYFKKKLGNNQLYFQAYVEQLYLHSRYYTPNTDILKKIGLDNTPYALVRYISYDAHHDSEIKPLKEEVKKQLVVELSKKMRVLVSSESDIIDKFYKPYQVCFSPEKMHDVMAHASFFLTEGATMASEACILGVPYLYINPLQNLGNILEQVKMYPSIACQSSDSEKISALIQEKITQKITPEFKEKIKHTIEKTTINPTDFFVWFVENYPKSARIMKENSDFQYTFK